MNTEELNKRLVKDHIMMIDIMIRMLEEEEEDIRKKEVDIVCNLESLYKKKEEFITFLSGSEFNASLLDQDWDSYGTLTLSSKVFNKKIDIKTPRSLTKQKLISDRKKRLK